MGGDILYHRSSTTELPFFPPEIREHKENPLNTQPSSPRRFLARINLTNILFLAAVHVLAIAAIPHLIANFSWRTLGLAVLWFGLCGISVTGGYHRLFAHPTHKCARSAQAFYLLFGAGALQNSALKWASDHRRHHAYTDKDLDPYNIKKGFWWAHMGWVFVKGSPPDYRNVADLMANRPVRFQHRFYLALAPFVFLLPACIASLWGDFLGGLLVAGFLRLMVQYHATFSVNSFAHSIGKQPYSLADSSRDSFFTALVTLGEGYHNFHHRFQWDYRNGVRWYQFDPTKWWIWLLSKVGAAENLRRASRETIEQAKAFVRAQKTELAKLRSA